MHNNILHVQSLPQFDLNRNVLALLDLNIVREVALRTWTGKLYQTFGGENNQQFVFQCTQIQIVLCTCDVLQEEKIPGQENVSVINFLDHHVGNLNSFCEPL